MEISRALLEHYLRATGADTYSALRPPALYHLGLCAAAESDFERAAGYTNDESAEREEASESARSHLRAAGIDPDVWDRARRA